MNRRKFLRSATQFGIGVGAASATFHPHSHASTMYQQSNTGWTVQADLPRKVLENPWLIATDPTNIGREEKWFLKPTAAAKPARVPGIIQEAFPGYHGLAWYWIDFTTDYSSNMRGRYLLSFGAVDYIAEVWLNGVRIGSHEGSESPFEFDVTDSIKTDSSNRLAVRVLNPGKEAIDGIVLEETPHRNKTVDYRPGNGPDAGGIWQPVVLLISPSVRTADLILRPDCKSGRIEVQASVHNSLHVTTRIRCHVSVSLAPQGSLLLMKTMELDAPAGNCSLQLEMQVPHHELWDLQNPALYRVTVRVEAERHASVHEVSANCGFRDFRVVNGFFRLNGKRLFLRSTHTGNHCPYGQTVPPPGYPDILRSDLFYSKSVGFNTVRSISGMMLPYQLDLCDEIGLLVYEESLASWLLHDSPKMKERYEFSVRDMVLRDRNHPCLAIWGLLNETNDGPVFREAVSALGLVRSLDPTRLVLLSSGRWDGHLGTGSISNPNTSEWECVWGQEAPGAGSTGSPRKNDHPNAHNVVAYDEGMGDIHFYPEDPQTPEVNALLRTMGKDSKPIFLTETGIGSMMDVIHEARSYEQAGVPSDAEDYQLVRSMADKLTDDWQRWGMETVYPFAENLLYASQQAMARHRLLVFNLIRANPKFCGYNLTGMLDHGYTGEGLWRFWRDFKPGAMDAVKDGWAAVRWCLFVNPTHTYLGRPVKIEAVLANEDILDAGDYAARFRVMGPDGVAWDQSSTLHIPQVAKGEDGPLAVPVLSEDVVLKGKAGAYSLIPHIDRGAAPPETSWQFHLSDPASLPRLDQKVVCWGMPSSATAWLKSNGASIASFPGRASDRRDLILVGDVSASDGNLDAWRELATRMERGSSVIFLSPMAFKRGSESSGWLPLVKKGRAYKFYDWLYHKECVAKNHPIFAGLQAGALLDWYYYGPMIPHWLFEVEQSPEEVIAAAFATGYPVPGGYASGVLVGKYTFGAGQFFVNTFPILDCLDSHPAADRMLINMIQFAGGPASGPLTELPADFEHKLEEIGYK